MSCRYCRPCNTSKNPNRQPPYITSRTSATGFYCGLTGLPEVPVQANRLAVGTCYDRLYQLTRATG
jgi:hypothetical protein